MESEDHTPLWGARQEGTDSSIQKTEPKRFTEVHQAGEYLILTTGEGRWLQSDTALEVRA